MARTWQYIWGMKTNAMRSLKLVLAALVATTTAAAADPAPTGPDFHAARSSRQDLARDMGVSTGHRSILPVDTILFGFDSSRLDAVDREQAIEAARWLAAHPRHRIILEGHADHTGPADYNMHLANLRVRAVRAWMMKAGADPSRIVIASYGEHVPMSDDPANNRQVVLYAERDTRPIARK
jgi:outer membrane protein OmpA-like peptidoglycan-associated protein